MTILRGRAIALCVAGMVGAAVPATVDAQPPPPDYYYPSLWQGWYAGVHLGHGDAGWADGFLGGAQVGYNWESGQLVYGLEADITWSDISRSETITGCVPASPPECISARASASIDWMATVRGRLGYLFQPGLLAYATAGFGFVSGSDSLSVNVPGFHFRSVSDTETDFVYGIGLEGRLSPASTLRVEYLGFSDTEIDVIRAGLNFKFGN